MFKELFKQYTEYRHNIFAEIKEITVSGFCNTCRSIPYVHIRIRIHKISTQTLFHLSASIELAYLDLMIN